MVIDEHLVSGAHWQYCSEYLGAASCECRGLNPSVRFGFCSLCWKSPRVSSHSRPQVRRIVMFVGRLGLSTPSSTQSNRQLSDTGLSIPQVYQSKCLKGLWRARTTSDAVYWTLMVSEIGMKVFSIGSPKRVSSLASVDMCVSWVACLTDFYPFADTRPSQSVRGKRRMIHSQHGTKLG